MNHSANLNYFCRLCGQDTVRTHSESFHVKQWSTVINRVYSMKVESDPEYCPKYLCLGCRVKVKYYRSEIRKRHTPKPSNPATAYDYTKCEGSNCRICAFVRAKTPRKPKNPKKTPSKPGQHECHPGCGSPKSKKRLFSEIDENKTEKQSNASNNHNETSANQRSIYGVERFAEKTIAEKFQCSICFFVPGPGQGVQTDCSHQYCAKCISTWRELHNTCPVCRDIIESVVPRPTQVEEILHVFCNICKTYQIFSQMDQHEKLCGRQRRTRGPGKAKKNLKDITKIHAKEKRLKPLISFVKRFCKDQYENVTDVLFFMLIDELDLNDEKKKVATLRQMWYQDKESTGLTAEDCLALRVDTLQSKTQYTKQYNFLKERGDVNFVPPCRLDVEERKFLPDCAALSVNPMPAVVPEIPRPNCIGVRFNYPTAIQHTLTEIELEISKKIEELGLDKEKCLNVQTKIKDGGDGMGDVSVYKEKSKSVLPDKALRYSFCVLETTVTIDGIEHTLFKEDKPNSVKSNRPLLEAIADENDCMSSCLCLKPIEIEREAINNQEMKISTGLEGCERKHKLKIFSSMEDEKFDRAFGGLAGSGSRRVFRDIT